MFSQRLFFATKAPSCSQCGVQGPKHFLLPQHSTHRGNESPCRHEVGVCNCCWLKYLELELGVTAAQATSEKQQKTEAAKIQCVECGEPLRDIDIFMRGGSDVFDMYQSMRTSESTRAADDSITAKKGQATAAWAFFQHRKTASSGEYNAFSEGKGKKNFSAT